MSDDLQYSQATSWRPDRIARLGTFCVLATGLVIPLATSLMSIFSILALACWIFSGQAIKIKEIFTGNAVGRTALLFFALLILGLSYSSVSLSESLGWLKKYRELLLMVAFMPFLKEEKHRQWAIYSFFIGVLVSLFLSSLMGVGLVRPKIWGYSVLSPITHTTFMSFFVFWLAHSLLDDERHRFIKAALIAWALYNIFFMTTGRTGQVVFIVLAVLFMKQRFVGKKYIIGMVLVISLLAVFLSFSDKFSNIINEIQSDTEAYMAGDTYTDIGLRLEFAQNSLLLVKKRPFTGYGTGSFSYEYRQLAAEKGILPTENPHNEYLVLAVQLGVVGLGALLYLFIVQWQEAGKLERNLASLAQGLVLTMATGCLANSWLLDSHEGHFFAYFSALLFAAPNRAKAGVDEFPADAGNLEKK